LIREFPITDPNQAESDANTDADLLRPHFAVGHKAFLYLYDGDTGECICTVVALPE
jgi:hypothetical protein